MSSRAGKINYFSFLIIVSLIAAISTFIALLVFENNLIIPQTFWLSIIIITISLTLTFQGIFTLMAMLSAWEDPKESEKHKSPSSYLTPNFSFTALIPARHEKNVISQTIQEVSAINYPEDLKEIIVLCRGDDTDTIEAADKTIQSLGKDNIRLVVFYDLPINKPHGLNIGLRDSRNQIITIFDAEDQPHPDIYNIINTLMSSEQVDVIQSGVQLMNYKSHWFSSINVLEYFFWFKSGLNFFSKIGNITPLGGNTVFFKKTVLEQIGGWDENCLTEDADVGIRLTKIGAKMKVIYDEAHVTKEETPDTINSFIKQRTRWNQGFLQIFMKGDWKDLPENRQKIVALYTFFSPILQALFFAYIPLEIYITVNYELPLIVTITSFIPFYILILQITVYFVGIREFIKVFKMKYSILDSLKILLAFFPYQIMLAIASCRAIFRLLYKEESWEKTIHNNAHRQISETLLGANAYAKNSVR